VRDYQRIYGIECDGKHRRPYVQCFLEGWAHDPQHPGRALTVAISFKKPEIGRGLANRFRWDLADVSCGTGWCAFRLWIDGMINALRRGPLILIDVAQNIEISRLAQIPLAEDSEGDLLTVADVIETDPTVTVPTRWSDRSSNVPDNALGIPGRALALRLPRNRPERRSPTTNSCCRSCAALT
jgi:hypothetical protein